MAEIQKLLDIMARLREPGKGCPWDQEQTFASIAPYTIEEAYEVADAIAHDDRAALRDELGDLLFQVVFHAQMAAEEGEFTFADVVAAISDKLVRRHPHVFGSAAEVAAGHDPEAWETFKARERAGSGDGSRLAGVPRALPALKRAQKLGKRAASAGFDWPDLAGVRAKVGEEIGELDAELAGHGGERIEEELGDVMFALVNLARHLGIDSEHALERANRKFESRFRAMEKDIEARGQDLSNLSIDELEQAWQSAKTRIG
jgi:MazG family protein